MMITAKQKSLNNKQELSEKQKLLNVIRDWVSTNKKIFWKYKVSCFYQTYKIKVTHLPKPLPNNIVLSSNNRLLDSQQKAQLGSALAKACASEGIVDTTSINVQIDYDDGVVITKII